MVTRRGRAEEEGVAAIAFPDAAFFEEVFLHTQTLFDEMPPSIYL